MDGIILLDDGRGSFGPMTDLRGSFDLRTGALTTAQRFERRLGMSIETRIATRDLTDLVNEAHPVSSVESLSDDGHWLVLNGRFPDAAEAPELAHGALEIDAEDGALLRGALSGKQIKAWLASGEELPDVSSSTVDAPGMLRYPWDILASAAGRIEGDLELLCEVGGDVEASLGSSVTLLGNSRVLIQPDVELGPGVVLDARDGVIVIGSGCRVGPGAVLVGPVAIGEGCHVAPHTHLKAGTIAGPHCRLGGEIGASIFQGYANKSHHGHLGDSWVGEWANLGAGTVNSNLLNTYGEVIMRVEPEGPTLRTGRTFLGCVIGDHVKTAIGTRIMTGSVLGTGSMIASSTPPPLVTPRFSWVTDRDTHLYRFEKFMDVAHRVMDRRGIEPGPHYVSRLKAIHEAMG